jgi:chloramphenicol 3-O-phosphotransferase
MTDAVVLTGPPGAGKSSVLEALSTLLEIGGVQHGAIESEQLSRGHPSLGAEVWIAELALVLAAQRSAGRRLFLVVATTETEEELRRVLEAARAERSLVVCLRAPADELAARLERREPDRWPGKAGLIAHARDLAAVIPTLAGIDVTLDTSGRDPAGLADEVLTAMRARGLVQGAAGA